MHPEMLDLTISAQCQTLSVTFFVCSRVLFGTTDDGTHLASLSCFLLFCFFYVFSGKLPAFLWQLEQPAVLGKFQLLCWHSPTVFLQDSDQPQAADLSLFSNLRSLPDTFGRLTSLQHLEMTTAESLEELPPSFGCLSSLRTLHMKDCPALSAS